MEKNNIIDERTGIPYTLIGDYYLPWGGLPDDDPEQQTIGIWGQRHLRYIKQSKKLLYTEMLTSGRLNTYLADIDKQAEKLFSQLIKQLAKSQGVNEKLKADEGMKWVGLMNNIRASAEEVVLKNLIYT